MTPRTRTGDDTAEIRVDDASSGPRLDRLRGAVKGMRTGRRGWTPDRVSVTVGGALVGLGLLVILLGWWGASRTPFVFEQIPYMISGGMLGLALAFLGGFAYFAYWVARFAQQSREQAERAEETLARIESLLSSNGHSPAPAATSDRAGSNGVFLATRTGTMFHRPDCPVVVGRQGIRSVSRTESVQMEPCSLCDPLG